MSSNVSLKLLNFFICESEKIWCGYIAVTVYLELMWRISTECYEKRVMLGTLVFSGIHTVLASFIFGMTQGGVWYVLLLVKSFYQLTNSFCEQVLH